MVDAAVGGEVTYLGTGKSVLLCPSAFHYIIGFSTTPY
jgi:hypothetical protein